MNYRDALDLTKDRLDLYIELSNRGHQKLANRVLRNTIAGNLLWLRSEFFNARIEKHRKKCKSLNQDIHVALFNEQMDKMKL